MRKHEGIDSVTITIEGEVSDEFLADDNYALDVPIEANFTVTPSKDINIRNGVSTYDLLQIQRHILTLDTLDSPYKIIAADINHSNSISAFDLVVMRKVILFDSDTFPNNTSWRFVPSDFVFSNPVDPFDDDFPESIEFTDIQGNTNADFTGIKIGDVNGSANPDEIINPLEDRNSRDTIQFYIDNQILKKGEKVEIPIKVESFEKMIGLQFALSFDPSAIEIEEIKSENLTGFTQKNIGLKYKNQGLITVSWDNLNQVNSYGDGDLFQLTIKVLRDTDLSKALSFNPELLESEAYNFNNDILALTLSFNAEQKSLQGQEKELQLFPNPFSEKIVMRFNLEDENAQLLIYDYQGKLVFEKSKEFRRGNNEIEILGSQLPGEGVYFVQLKDKNKILSSKQIIYLK